MRLPFSLFLLFTVSTIFAQRQLDLSAAGFESGHELPLVEHFDAASGDYFLANPGASAVSWDRDGYLNVFVDLPKTAFRSFSNLEVCYSSLEYVRMRGRSFDLNAPSPNVGSGYAPTSVGQLRVSQPLKSRPGSYQVIQDFIVKPPFGTASTTCRPVSLATALPNTKNYRIYLDKIAIGAEQVLRVESIKIW